MDKMCCKKGGCTLAMVAKILVVIGGINWGLVGLGMLLGDAAGWNVVNMVLGDVSPFEAIVYVIVGVAAIMLAFGCNCGKCKGGVCASCPEVKEENKTEGGM